MSPNIKRFHALEWQQRKVLLAALVLLPLIGGALRIVGLNRLQAWLEGFPLNPVQRPCGTQIAMLNAMVGLGARQVGASCLQRALLLRWLLRRRGLRSELRIGVRFDDGRLDAHAWLESGGTPIDEAPDIASRFAVFDRPIALASWRPS